MKKNLLVLLLRDTSLAKQLTLAEWDLLLRQARSSGLLARLYYIFTQKNIKEDVPQQVLRHFLSDWVFYEKLKQSVNWEIIQLKIALKKKKLVVPLMKGAAYVALDLEASKGRIFSDMDLLFSKDDLDYVENVLMNAGWMGTHHSAYDRKYYRQWMHEIPPLRHVRRASVLDVHHNILPLTADIRVDAKKILGAMTESGIRGVYCLSKEDLVIHSATHLFHEGEFKNGLRDISDLDLLLKEFSLKENFWLDLCKRAQELKLEKQLFYAFRYTTTILKTPIPEDIKKRVEPFSPNKFVIRLMDFLFLRALMPDHPSCDDRWTGLARWLLYIRAHWLRMPLYLLIPHLLRKSGLRLTGKESH